MGMFTSDEDNKKKLIKEADERQCINSVLIEREFGTPLIFVDGRSSNMFVYEDMVVMDRSKGGIFNSFNHTIKVIPMTSIKTLQFKNGGVFVGAIEVGVSGSDANEKKIVDTDNENLIMFGTKESTKNAIDAYFYISKRISGRA